MIFTLKRRIGIGIGVSLGIIFFFWAGVYNPQAKLIKKTRGEIAGENLKLSQMEASFKEYKELKEECEAMNAELASLEGQLIQEEEFFSFFQELGLRAKTYSIEYVKIVPEKVISGEYYNQIPVRMQLYSTYHALGMFLSDIAKNQGMSSVRVENIKMKGITEKKGKENYTIETELLMSVYSKKDSSQEAAAKKGQGLTNSLELEGVETDIEPQRVQERRK